MAVRPRRKLRKREVSVAQPPRSGTDKPAPSDSQGRKQTEDSPRKASGQTRLPKRAKRVGFWLLIGKLRAFGVYIERLGFGLSREGTLLLLLMAGLAFTLWWLGKR